MSSNAPHSSKITAGEVAAAMNKAHELNIRVQTRNSQRPPSEMEMMALLETVFDARAEEIAGRIREQQRREALGPSMVADEPAQQ